MSDKITQVLEGLMKENPEMHDLYKDRLTRAQQTPFAQRVGKQNWEAAKVKLMAVLTAVEEQLNKMDKGTLNTNTKRINSSNAQPVFVWSSVVFLSLQKMEANPHGCSSPVSLRLTSS